MSVLASQLKARFWPSYSHGKLAERDRHLTPAQYLAIDPAVENIEERLCQDTFLYKSFALLSVTGIVACGWMYRKGRVTRDIPLWQTVLASAFTYKKLEDIRADERLLVIEKDRAQMHREALERTKTKYPKI